MGRLSSEGIIRFSFSDAASDPSSRLPFLSDHPSPDLTVYLCWWPFARDVRDERVFFAYADALRDRGIDARVVVETIDRDETETGVRGPVEVRVERVTHPVMPEDIPEPAQEGSVVERLAELERDNRRLRGTMSVESQRVDRLQRGMSRMQRELRQMRRLRFYDRVRVGRLEACARKHMGYRFLKMPNTRSGASMTREEFEELVVLFHPSSEELEAARDEEMEMETEEMEMEMEEMEMEMEEMEMEMETEMEIMDSALTWNESDRVGDEINGHDEEKMMRGKVYWSQPPFKEAIILWDRMWPELLRLGNNERKGICWATTLHATVFRLHHEGLCTLWCGNCRKAGLSDLGLPGHFQEGLSSEKSGTGKQTRNKTGNNDGNQTGGRDRSFVLIPLVLWLDVTPTL
ncbi:hypothetical protein Tco_0360937 [Tanacetum coccineum]